VTDDQEVLEPASRPAWRDWLAANGSRPGGVWLAVARRNAPGLSYEDAVEEAVAFGWIDSKARRTDDQSFKVWFSPRKRGSVWARSNKERVERLMQAGGMAQPGLAVVAAAKADGSWDRLDKLLTLDIPADLAVALEANPEAARHFYAFPASSRRMILAWIAMSRQPETRQKRIAETVDMAARNLRAGLQRQSQSACEKETDR
jgi:uncharacterized protein YdeI (YjbR/CyaY-like superfamily)